MHWNCESQPCNNRSLQDRDVWKQVRRNLQSDMQWVRSYPRTSTHASATLLQTQSTRGAHKQRLPDLPIKSSLTQHYQESRSGQLRCAGWQLRVQHTVTKTTKYTPVSGSFDQEFLYTALPRKHNLSSPLCRTASLSATNSNKKCVTAKRKDSRKAIEKARIERTPRSIISRRGKTETNLRRSH